jgi:hypothetical protein
MIWQTIENEKFSVATGENISFFEVLMSEYPYVIHPGNFFFFFFKLSERRNQSLNTISP